MMYEFMKDDRYKNIAKKYVDAMVRKQNQIKADVRPERIKEEADNVVKEIAEELTAYFDTRMAEIEKGKAEIVKSYKKRGKTYTDPQAETLKRQDFDMEVAVASEHDLEDIAKDTDRELSKYELGKLQLEFKKRNMTSTDLIRKRINDKQAHETDPNYQKLVSDQTQMLHVKPKGRPSENWVLLPNTAEGERPTFNSVGELGRLRDDALQVDKLTQGYKELEKNMANIGSYKASYNPVVKSEAEAYADRMIETGEYKNIKKYADDDLRAIEGSSEYDVVDEFKYLKERYHDESNELYSLGNPDYSVHNHVQYLRNEHEKELARNPDLANKIEQALGQHEPAEETAE